MRIASTRLRAPSFCMTEDRWLRTVPGERYSAAAISATVPCPRAAGEHLALARRQRALALAQRRRRQAGIDDPLAGDRAPDRRGQLGARARP